MVLEGDSGPSRVCPTDVRLAAPLRIDGHPCKECAYRRGCHRALRAGQCLAYGDTYFAGSYHFIGGASRALE